VRHYAFMLLGNEERRGDFPKKKEREGDFIIYCTMGEKGKGGKKRGGRVRR